MKKCPTCDRTFDDSLKFCQIDGTPLVDSAPNDSFKTMVGSLISEDDEADSGQSNKSTSPFSPNDPFSQPSFNNPPASPFGDSSRSDSGSTPSTPFQEPQSSYNQSPFGNQSPNQPEWTPPPAPVAEWQNQNLGTNTPFQPPIGQNQNQTLPIISLVFGVLSFVLMCCYGGLPFGLAALITGYLGIQNINKDSSIYTGKTLAIVGMILGGIGFILSIIFLIFGIASSFINFPR